MFRKFIPVAAAATTLLLPLAGHAQIVVDGTIDSAYGGAKVVQDSATGFGDNNVGSTTTANGSELDGAFGVVSNGTLYLGFTGNLETNYNQLNIFIDSTPGGQNTLANNSNGGNISAMNGLTFDGGITPDYYLQLNGGGSPTTFYVDYATLPTAGGGAGYYLGSFTTTGSTTTLTGGDPNTLGIQVGLNNSNTAGVTGSSVSGADLVTTGMEFGIPLSAIGNPTGAINITAFINGGGANFLSNQVAGPLGQGNTPNNLGNPANVNFATIAGNQYFTVAVAPEPNGIASMAIGVLTLGGIIAVRRRRQAV